MPLARRNSGFHAVRAETVPLSEDTFRKMQNDLMLHILVLEVLIALLLFAIIVMAGVFGFRFFRRRERPGRRSFKQLHERRSSDSPLPLTSYSHSTSPTYNNSSYSPPIVISGKESYAKTLPRTPPGSVGAPSVRSVPMQISSPKRSASPLKPVQDTASLLDEELASAPAPPRTSPAPAPGGKKSARHLSVPQSAWQSSADGTSVSGSSGAGYPTLSDFLSRIQATSNRDLTQYTPALVAHGWSGLDELRGVSVGELRNAIRSMTSTDAEFLVKSVKQECDWIDADRARGGMGFRMVLNN